MWRSQQKEIMRISLSLEQWRSRIPDYQSFWRWKSFLRDTFYLFTATRASNAGGWYRLKFMSRVSCSFACIIFLCEAYKPFKGISRWWMAGAVSEIYNNNNDGFLSLFISLVCVCACVLYSRGRISRILCVAKNFVMVSGRVCHLRVFDCNRSHSK